MEKDQILTKEFITKFLPNITIVVIFLIVGILVYLNSPKNTDISQIIETSKQTNQEIESLKQEIQLSKQWFILKSDSCNFEYTGTYKYLDLYEVEYITPKQKPKVNEYTKKISISGEVQEVKVCILADVRDDHKVPGYSFYVYTYLWSDIHRGYLNVWRYKESQQLFDRDVWWRNQELYGRFNGDETPFRQVIDLERVIFADTQGDEYYKYTRPIVNFQKTWAINVWAYVEWDSHWYAWKILQFRIIYKWGLIEIK